MSSGERVCIEDAQGRGFKERTPGTHRYAGTREPQKAKVGHEVPSFSTDILTPEVMMTDWNRSKTGFIAMEASMQLRRGRKTELKAIRGLQWLRGCIRRAEFELEQHQGQLLGSPLQG